MNDAEAGQGDGAHFAAVSALLLPGLEHARQLLVNDPRAALHEAQEVAEQALTQDDPRAQAEALRFTAGVHQLLAHDPLALDLAWKAALLFETIGDGAAQVACLHMAAMSHLALGQYGRALEHLDRALSLARAVRDRSLEVTILDSLALARQKLGDFGRAGRYFDPGLSLRRELGELLGDGVRLNNLAAEQIDDGHRLLARGDGARAGQVFAFALDLLTQARGEPGGTRLSALIALNVGLAHAALEHGQSAHEAFGEALLAAHTLGDVRLQASVQTELAQLALAAGDPARAEEALRTATLLLAGSGAQFELARVEAAFADLCQLRGDYARALAHHRRHHELELGLRTAAAEQQAQALAARLELQRAHFETELQRLRSVELEQQVLARTAELARARGEVVELLAAAAESRDRPSGSHIRWVGEAARLLALALGMSLEAADDLGLAAQLHDIGKIAVPDHVLHKQGALEGRELAQMREHAVQGARILQGGTSSLLRLAAEVARTHHEAWDGSGYPEGLRGEAIPLSGRIVCVVDTYDALISERPYKPAWPGGAALAYLHEHAGTRFDPGVVAAFGRLYLEGALPERG